MTVDITYIAIDSRGKKAVLRGEYSWGNQRGDLISALQKDGSDWKIRAIDYTGGKARKASQRPKRTRTYLRRDC